MDNSSTRRLDQKSHVCLVWLKRDPQDAISDSKKSEINEARLRWELGGHSVSIWMLAPGFDDVDGIEEQGVPQRVFDIRTVLKKYNYSEAFPQIDYFFLRIDILKLLIPLYILEHGLSETTFENCIACDIDIGTRDEGVTDEHKVFDLKHVYDHDTNEKLDRMGVVFAEGPSPLVSYENSFAIFRNHASVILSLSKFVAVMMDLEEYDIVASNQKVWTWIPTFVQHLKGVRYGGVVRHGNFPEYEEQDLKSLFYGPYPNKFVAGDKSHNLRALLKKIPVPKSQFASGGDIQGPGRTPFFFALGLAALTFVMSFVPRSYN